MVLHSAQCHLCSQSELTYCSISVSQNRTWFFSLQIFCIPSRRWSLGLLFKKMNTTGAHLKHRARSPTQCYWTPLRAPLASPPTSDSRELWGSLADRLVAWLANVSFCDGWLGAQCPLRTLTFCSVLPAFLLIFTLYFQDTFLSGDFCLFVSEVG